MNGEALDPMPRLRCSWGQLDLQEWAEGIMAPLGRDQAGQPMQVEMSKAWRESRERRSCRHSTTTETPTRYMNESRAVNQAKACVFCGATGSLLRYTDEELGATWGLCDDCSVQPAEIVHEAEQQRLAGERKSLEKQDQGLLFADTVPS